MFKNQARTDLALEAREMVMEQTAQELQGAKFFESDISGFKYQILTVTSEGAAEKLGKPIGKYCTIEIDPVMRRDVDAFQRGVKAISCLLKQFIPFDSIASPVMLVGLGNRAITPDSIGPLVLESSLVTRHLKQNMPKDFAAFRDVSAVTPGVLGTSGIESSDYIKSLAEDTSPDFLIAIDALAARSMSRLCRTVQISNTGITPGSGVGNSRAALNETSLGIPVIAVGVPTVVDVQTIFADFGGEQLENRSEDLSKMIVTPRSIDSEVSSISRLVGYSINVALHDGLTISDVDMLLG